jgi:hypothetical protein
MTSPYLDRPIRSRAQALEELRAKLLRLQFLDPERKDIVRRIVALEDDMERCDEDFSQPN